MDIADQVTREISGKLRGYDGMRPEKLIDCPGLLGVVGTSDPVKAYERIVGALDRMPQDKYTEALRNALGLVPGAADSLTGTAGRRGAFAEKYDVSQETVKLWEGRAIITLTRYLLSGLTEPREELYAVSVVFYILDDKIRQKSVRKVWMRSNSYRFDDYKEFTERDFVPTFLYHQVEPGHSIETLDLVVLFPANEAPAYAAVVEGRSTWDHMTGNLGDRSNYRILRDPAPALDVLAETSPPSRNEVEALSDAACYHVEFARPEPMKLYGLIIGRPSRDVGTS